MTPSTIGVAIGAPQGVYRELTTALEHVAREEGHDVRRVADAEAARTVDVIVAIGYPGYYTWLGEPAPGPRLAWLGEPLPPAIEGSLPRLRRQLPMGRFLDTTTSVVKLGGAAAERLVEWRERAAYEHVQRVNLAAHRRAARSGIRLIVTSEDAAASLDRVGIDAAVVPFGSHPAWSGPPHPIDDADRDIDVLIFGTGLVGAGVRRARHVDGVIAELGPGVRTHIVRTAVWGMDRCRLLGRARVVLNINKVPGNFLGVRGVLQAAAGAVGVSDPIRTPAPFIPGIHYLEAPVDDLAATIAAILADRPRRLRIADAAQRLIVEDLTMARSLSSVLATLR